MIQLWYIDTREINTELFKQLLNTVPTSLSERILKYRHFSDQKAKLMGKLMVAWYHKKMLGNFQWSTWELDPHKKPFIKDGISFNISHSKHHVIVGFGKGEIGVDLEHKDAIKLDQILTQLHPEEIQFIKLNENRNDAFYRVWTRKEAFLKAVGIGIVEGLVEWNCVADVIFKSESWHIYSLQIIPDYELALCINYPLNIDAVKIIKLNAPFCQETSLNIT